MNKPPVACNRPGCHGTVIDGKCNYCGPRRSSYEDRRGSAASRGYDREWQRLRLMVLRREPLCRMCAEAGIITPATDVDHIIRKSDGGLDTFENLQPLCHSHHSQKTATEKMGGTLGQRASVTVVAGPPGAGKTTWVNTQKKWGDVILDVDALFVALTGLNWYEKPAGLLPIILAARDAVIARLRQPSEIQHAWVITSESDQQRLATLVQGLDAELVLLSVDASECIRRIANDNRRNNHLDEWKGIVARWWSTYRATGQG